MQRVALFCRRHYVMLHVVKRVAYINDLAINGNGYVTLVDAQFNLKLIKISIKIKEVGKIQHH